jgi:hypothetical protein
LGLTEAAIAAVTLLLAWLGLRSSRRAIDRSIDRDVPRPRWFQV